MQLSTVTWPDHVVDLSWRSVIVAGRVMFCTSVIAIRDIVKRREGQLSELVVAKLEVFVQ
jgi:hypothetical protein